MELKGRVAVVTGAARGIGEAIARELYAAGAAVALVDLEREAVDAACRRIAVPPQSAGAEPAASAPQPDADRIAGFTCDVSRREDVEALFDSVDERFGRLDILVNNAGITRDAVFSRMTPEPWQRVIDVNLTGTYLCCRGAEPLLRRSPHGRIVNISSISAGGNIGQANYAASKAGVLGLTRTLAIELARHGITVNAVAPGFIDTEMTRAVPEPARKVWLGRIPVGRAGTAEDVAHAVAFLVSDDGAYITGDVVEVDGGLRTPEAVAAVFGGSIDSA